MRIVWKHLYLRIGLACLWPVARTGWAGASVSSPAADASVSQALITMAQHAGVIFAGEVVSVTRTPNSGFADVRFRIEEAVRGCAQSGFYVLREWDGLWVGHAERYRPGQQFVMLLTARGPSGLSAPLGGSEGAIPILVDQQPPIADGAGLAPPDEGPALRNARVDLRWVEARRTVRGRSVPGTSSARTSSETNARGPSIPGASSFRAPMIRALVAAVPASGDAATHPTLRSVIAILQSAGGEPNVRP